MKLLHIISGLSSGGAERALYNLIKNYESGRNEVAVLSLKDQGIYGTMLRQSGIPVYELGLKHAIPSPDKIAKLRTVVRECNPYIIQGWMYHGNLAASLAGILATKNPMVAWNVRHSLYSLSQEKFFTRHVIRLNRSLSTQADAIVYNSELSRQQHESMGFANSTGLMIPNGFDTTALKPMKKRYSSVRETLGVAVDEHLIGHVARLHPMKDHLSFLRAAVRVLQHRPKTRFLMIGRDVNQSLAVFQNIVPAKLVNRFIMLGERMDVHELMQALDIFCLTSAWGEAFPNVLGEAMALGVPCVTTDVGDSAEIVGDTGLIIPPSNTDALTDAVLKMLSISNEKRYFLANAARERIIDRYSLANTVQQYSELYERLENKYETINRHHS